MDSLQARITERLDRVLDPTTEAPLSARKSLKAVTVQHGVANIELELSYPARSQHSELQRRIEAALQEVAPDLKMSLHISTRVVAHKVQGNVQLLPGVRNIVLVASGKGGVGKSTTAANLALALAQEGARTGLLDADIYGPSQPMMMGLVGEQPESDDGKTMRPLLAHGVQVNSIGFLIDPDQPMVWRGPMATQALRQLLNDTRWDDLDYLVIDMPPGTGDIQLTLAQSVPVTGAVIVTTPQDIALLDARKGLKMFEKVGIPILGVVENMSIHVCSNCGHAEHIFGAGGGEKMCADYGVPFLGSLPLDIQIREQADGGAPTVVSDPEGPIARAYRQIALRVGVALADKQRDMRLKFPTIVVKDS